MKKSIIDKIDLSKLKVEKINELKWQIIIEKETKRPKELGGNKVISKKAEFSYYKDKKGNYWLCNCSVPDEYQKKVFAE